MKKTIFAVAIGALFLAACGDEVPVDQIDQNQSISRKNATLNAKRFAAVRFPQAEQIIVQSDSTVSKNCRFGDGWASGEIFQGGRKLAEFKCQTNGDGKGLNGCLLKDDFNTKDYKSEEGTCNRQITELRKMGE